MSPPGKNNGRTTKESVVKAIRGGTMPLPPAKFRLTVAWPSSDASTSLPKAGTNKRWLNSAVNRPPLPWPSITRSYDDRGSGHAPNGGSLSAAAGSAIGVGLHDEQPGAVIERAVHDAGAFRDPRCTIGKELCVRVRTGP